MKLRKFNYILISILIIMIILVFYQFSFTGNIITGRFLSLEGYVNTYAHVDENNLYLISGCNALVMSITQDQALSINLGLRNVSGSRPLTHDLMRDLFDLFGMEVLMVKIERLENEAYYARLFLRQGNKILNLDSRPSDAVAIATRYNKPVFVKKELFESEGRRIC